MEKRLRLHVLGTGSKGNASIVEDAQTGHGILIDSGLCRRDFLARCEEASFNPANLDAVFITHEHTDHTKGLGVVLRWFDKAGLDAPVVYANAACANNSRDIGGIRDIAEVRDFSCDQHLTVGSLSVYPFRTVHDAAFSCGFRVECADDALGFMTDTGVVTDDAHEALAQVRLLALEANHDLHMLQTGPYPFPLKQRIASVYGHLSNDQAAHELSSLLSDNLECVVGMHASQTNNTYVLPQVALEQISAQEGLPFEVRVGRQSALVSVG